MNKVMTLLFILLLSVCNAATGNASDGQLFAIVIIMFMLLIVAIGFFIDFMKSKFKEIRARRLTRKSKSDQDEELLNSFNKPFRELDRIPTY